MKIFNGLMVILGLVYMIVGYFDEDIYLLIFGGFFTVGASLEEILYEIKAFNKNK